MTPADEAGPEADDGRGGTRFRSGICRRLIWVPDPDGPPESMTTDQTTVNQKVAIASVHVTRAITLQVIARSVHWTGIINIYRLSRRRGRFLLPLTS